MEEWKEYRLGDLFERVTRKNTNLESKNVLTISAQHGLINQEEFFNKTVAGKNLTNYYLLKKGEFAYNKSYSKGYPMGATKMLDKYDNGIVSTLYICFRSKSDLVNDEYFKYYFESKEYYDELSKIAQEGARNHGLLNVSTKDFFNMKILIPSKLEQKLIAETLKKLDIIINKYEKLIIEKNKFIMSQFYGLFRDRNKCKLSDLAFITMGQSPDSASYNNKKEGLPFYQGAADFGEIFIKNNYYCNKPIRIAEPNDLLISVRAPVGNINFTDSRCCIGRGLAAIKPKEHLSTGWFLFFALKTMNKEIARKSEGSTFKSINKEVLYNLELPKVDIEEQNKFIRIAELHYKQQIKLKSLLQNYKQLKIGLMQNLITGKIRIKI